VATGAIVEAGVREVVAGGLKGDAFSGAAAAGAIVTLEAGRESSGGSKEPGVRGAMRLMAALASVDADCGVFEDEGSTFVDVAFEAGFFVAEPEVHHVRTRSGPPSWG